MILYNDNDRFAAQWLRTLIADERLPKGEVDERSIADLDADGIPDTFHAFAGIGGWPLALEWAGWEGPVWTGSCPCQPFSTAGKRMGADDERHLWPAFYRLIAERRPATVFGEQVAGRAGRMWLAAVRADLEDLGYAVGAADLPACSVGAPHIRSRLFWVAHAGRSGDQRRLPREARTAPPEAEGETWKRERSGSNARRGSAVHGMADPQGQKRGSGHSVCGRKPHPGEGGWLVYSDGSGSQTGNDASAPTRYGGAAVAAGRMDHLVGAGLERHAGNGDGGREPGWDEADQDRSVATTGAPDGLGHSSGVDEPGIRIGGTGTHGQGAFGGSGGWREIEWLECSDGKARATQPGIRPLADGIPGRVGQLRGYGNAIVPQVAAVFVRAFMEARG